MLPGEVRIGLVQRQSHLLGVLGVDAEHDRLGEPVGPLEVLGQVSGRSSGAP
jgi:hypothetical protein